MKNNPEKAFFLGLYVILVIDRILMLLGFQDIVAGVIPIWDQVYLILNVLVIVLMVSGIYFMLSSRLKLAHLFLLSLLFVWVFYTLIILYVSFAFNVIGGSIFRNSFNIVFCWVFGYRLYQLQDILRIGEEY